MERLRMIKINKKGIFGPLIGFFVLMGAMLVGVIIIFFSVKNIQGEFPGFLVLFFAYLYFFLASLFAGGLTILISRKGILYGLIPPCGITLFFKIISWKIEEDFTIPISILAILFAGSFLGDSS
jgi:sugar phosphate permease